MRTWIWHTTVLALLAGALGNLATADAHASGLIDWMSRCGQPAEPQIVCYPTTAYQVMATECCEPTVVCPEPCPPAVIYQPRPSFWQRFCGARQTPYRTSWQQVPVTSYRPVASVDPVTGCPVTVMRPCSTYTWQPQRKLGCGLFDGLFGWCDRRDAQVQYCMPTDCCPTVISSDCCEPSSGAMAPIPPSSSPTPATAPYYSPSPAQPAAPGVMPPAANAPPSTWVPGTPPATLAPGLAPSTTPPSGALPLRPQTPVPAEVRPTLKPADPLPTDAEVEGPLDTGRLQPLPQIESGAGVGQGLPPLGPPVTNPERSVLNPVPGPNTTPATPAEQNAAPPLINRRDQTASLRTGQSWAVVPVVWPAVVPDERAPRTEAPVRRDLRQWDESGWHSVRKAP